MALNVSGVDGQVFDGLASELSRASMDEGEGGQASSSSFMPAGNVSSQSAAMGFPSVNHVVCQVS